MSVHHLVQARRDQGVGIVYYAKRAALPPDMTIRAIVAQIRKMVRLAGFPPPATPRILGDKVLEGADAVWAHARWPQDQVDAWFDDRTPPALRLIADNAARRRDAERLDARAAALGQGLSA